MLAFTSTRIDSFTFESNLPFLANSGGTFTGLPNSISTRPSCETNLILRNWAGRL